MNNKTHFTKDAFSNRIYFSLEELAQARDTEDVSVDAEYSNQTSMKAETLRNIIRAYGLAAGYPP